MKSVKQKLKEALSQRQRRRIMDAGLVPSAVLLPILYRRGQNYILFTKRTEGVPAHKGQVSFPGGAYQEVDGTLLNTALRECAEEIGLPADKVEILGELDDTVTDASGYVITPFVALITPPYRLKVNKKEIDEVFEVPIPVLIESRFEGTDNGDSEGVASYSYYCRGKVVWGATARILSRFLDIFTEVAATRSQGRAGVVY